MHSTFFGNIRLIDLNIIDAGTKIHQHIKSHLDRDFDIIITQIELKEYLFILISSLKFTRRIVWLKSILPSLIAVMIWQD